MKYDLRKRLQEDTDYYHQDTLVKYLDFLEEDGRLVRIGNICFDAEAMLDPFVCNTRLCIPGRHGRTMGGLKHHRTCCGGYAPRISSKEKERIDTILPEIMERFPAVKELVEEEEGYYEWDEEYDRVLARPTEGWCIFMAKDPTEFGFHACMLHIFCKEKGLDPFLYKPSACLMFPLVLMDVDEDENIMLVSKHSHEVSSVGEDDDGYLELTCCSPNRLAKRPLYLEMKDTLVYMFGEEVWQKLRDALVEGDRE